jgi:hypothetical protein
MKCDDDTYVHSSNFAEFEPDAHDYIGCRAGGSYASGGYFLSRRAAELVAEAELDRTAEDRAVGNLLIRHGIGEGQEFVLGDLLTKDTERALADVITQAARETAKSATLARVPEPIVEIAQRPLLSLAPDLLHGCWNAASTRHEQKERADTEHS